jgi:uncharacterized protein involved in exopolysaccharide biosynthesis
MGEHEQPGELDLGQVMRRLKRRWPVVTGLALGGAVIAAVITMVMPPVFEAKATLIFPAGTSSGGAAGLQGLGLQNVMGQQNMELVEGIISSRAVEDEIVAATELKRDDIRENINVSQIPGRRQVIISYHSPSKATGLKVVTEVLARLAQVEDSIGVNTSGKRLNGYRNAFDEKAQIVKELEEAVLKFQKTAKTVPTSEDEFTGMTYLKARSDLQIELAKVNKSIDAQLSAAKRLGQGAANGLPTGLERESKWRDALLEASVAVDQARAKYQPGTPQLKAAVERLDSTRKNLIEEIGKYVTSVQNGADAQMSALFAQRLVVGWQLERAEELAKVAPIEAGEYRRLLDQLRVEVKARDELKIQTDTEMIRNKVEAKIWQVLDDPYIEENPINKKFGMNIALGLIVGGLLGTIVTSSSGKK